MVASIKFIASKDTVMNPIPTLEEKLNIQTKVEANGGNKERIIFTCGSSGKEGLVDLYFNKKGDITALYSSGGYPEKGELVANFLKDQGEMNRSGLKIGSVQYKNVVSEVFQEFENYIVSLGVEMIAVEKNHAEKCFKADGGNAKLGVIHISHYKTGTLQVQGKNCVLFFQALDFLEGNTDDSVEEVVTRYCNVLDIECSEISGTSIEGSEIVIKEKVDETNYLKLNERERNAIVSANFVLALDHDLPDYSWVVFAFLKRLRKWNKGFFKRSA
jgi:hypothetical protein